MQKFADSLLLLQIHLHQDVLGLRGSSLYWGLIFEQILEFSLPDRLDRLRYVVLPNHATNCVSEYLPATHNQGTEISLYFPGIFQIYPLSLFQLGEYLQSYSIFHVVSIPFRSICAYHQDCFSIPTWLLGGGVVLLLI